MLSFTSGMLSGARRAIRIRATAGTFLLLFMLLAASAAAAASSAGRAIVYRGVRIVVPRSWPVYDLARDPRVCVRFNRHAVYLGRPSDGQACPPRAAGRTDAVLLEPASEGSSHERTRSAALAGALPGAGTTAGAVRIGDVLATASWSRSPGLVERILGVRSLRRSERPFSAAAVRRDSARASAASATFSGSGVDACHAPSSNAMAAWSASPYRAIGIYIGGENMACSQVNLTAAWVSSETQSGWHLIPTYVGLQAPSNSCGCAAIRSSDAAAEGRSDAQNAVAQAQSLGLGPGNPIYDDMEGYSRTATNTAAVLSFLSAWTTQLHADGYLSGVYSSADSGVVDLVAQAGSGYPEPDDLWFARWNGSATTTDPNIPSGDWAAQQRIHQYAGDHYESYGGVSLDVDSDSVTAATAGVATAGSGGTGGAPAFPDGTFVTVPGTGGVFEILGGAPLFVSNSAFVGNAPVLEISQEQFDGLRSVPTDGTFLTTSTGATYRIAGGAPLAVTTWSVFGGPQPSATVDEWNIDNISSPLSHLNTVPANGTFLTTPSGAGYRVAGGAAFPVTNWSIFGSGQASVMVDSWDITNAGNTLSHLTARPADGTVVEGIPSRWYWTFYGGWRERSAPSAQAVVVNDAAIPSFPSRTPLPLPQCIVPRLHHLTVSQAKAAIAGTLCTLGRIRRPAHWRHGHTLRVVSQSPHAGRALPEEHRVGFWVR